MMIELKIFDEFSPLETVILGTAESFGGAPKIEEANDPKSAEHILKNDFPIEDDLRMEMSEVEAVLKKYEVQVLRPRVIPNYNQIFSRDVGFVIEDRLVVPFIAHSRRQEVKGLEYIIGQCNPGKVIRPPESQRVEGGDVMPWNGKLFVGYSEKEDFDQYVTARTNLAGVEFLAGTFTGWEVKAFELKKSDEDPRMNSLHLDCCFQPLGGGHVIIYKEGFKDSRDAEYLISLFDEDKIIYIDNEEMYHMNSNIFSIAPDIVISERKFTRLNQELRKRGFQVEEVNYNETAKMEGLLRCSTLPLKRSYV